MDRYLSHKLINLIDSFRVDDELSGGSMIDYINNDLLEMIESYKLDLSNRLASGSRFSTYIDADGDVNMIANKCITALSGYKVVKASFHDDNAGILLADGTILIGHNNIFTKATNLSNVIDIASGHGVLAILFSNGTVSIISIYDGKLVAGDNFPTNVIAISMRNTHLLMLTIDGKVYGSGHNYSSQMGRGRMYGFNEVIIVTNEPSIAISSGEQHSLILTIDGKVMRGGSYGFSGLGSSGISLKDPQIHKEVELLSYDVEMIASGAYHSLLVAKKSNGQVVLGIGSNNNGQLGIPIRSRAYNTFESYTEVLHVELPKRIVSISCGNDHSMVLISDGTNLELLGAGQIYREHPDNYQFTIIPCLK